MRPLPAEPHSDARGSSRNWVRVKLRHRMSKGCHSEKHPIPGPPPYSLRSRPPWSYSCSLVASQVCLCPPACDHITHPLPSPACPGGHAQRGGPVVIASHPNVPSRVLRPLRCLFLPDILQSLLNFTFLSPSAELRVWWAGQALSHTPAQESSY